MASRSRSRNLSFDILNTTTATSVYDVESILYDSIPLQNGEPPKPTGRKRNNRASKKKNKRKQKSATIDCSISEDSILDDPRPGPTENGSFRTEPDANCDSHSVESVIDACEPEESVGTVRPVTDFYSVRDFEGRELRQRSVGGGGGSEEAVSVSRIEEGDTGEESGCTEVDSVPAKQPNGGSAVRRLETAGSLDWKRLMAQDPHCK